MRVRIREYIKGKGQSESFGHTDKGCKRRSCQAGGKNKQKAEDDVRDRVRQRQMVRYGNPYREQHKEEEAAASYVIPISLRSFSVRVRKIRRSMSCSSSNGRYFEKPICSKNSARSYMKMRF